MTRLNVPRWRGWGVSAGLVLLAGCAADRGLHVQDAAQAVRDELVPRRAVVPNALPAAVTNALAEPTPQRQQAAPEPRIDLLVSNAQAREVFLALVADTRYSMLLHPDVAGTLSLTLRGVTLLEALEAIRDVYGYDFRVDGRRITVFAPTLQTRIFTINYPHSQRVGVSESRIASGSMPTSGGGASGTSGSNNAAGGSTGGTATQTESSKVSTASRTDYWAELLAAVRSMVGSGEGRSVISSPQAGILSVRAMPEEMRQIERFLRAAQTAVERQVMLEAKIVEVELRDGFQSGIDWSAFRSVNRRTAAIGSVAGNTANNLLFDSTTAALPGFPVTSTTAVGSLVGLPAAAGGLFGLALAAEGFQAVLGFLETRGDLQILSSPRIATLNNQKALLKVGTDDYYLTNISGGSNSNTAANTTGTTATALPTLTLTPFFSGIALDVTPQIDDSNNITLHVRPSVTTVVEKTKQVDLGAIGNYKLPLASSSVNESDTLVRIQDGNIVAIGGLMQMETNRSASGLPGSTDVPFWSNVLGNKASSGRKKELVVLIKPTIIRSADDWEAQTQRARNTLDDMQSERARVIRLEGKSGQ